VHCVIVGYQAEGTLAAIWTRQSRQIHASSIPSAPHQADTGLFRHADKASFKMLSIIRHAEHIFSLTAKKMPPSNSAVS